MRLCLEISEYQARRTELSVNLSMAIRMKVKNPASVAVKLIAIILLIGALGHQEYGYYTVLHWIVCGVSGFAAVQAARSERELLAGTLVIAAFIFNPLIQVHLKDGTWTFLDLGLAVLLLVSIATVDRNAQASGKT